MSVRAVGVPAETQTEYLPNTDHMCYLPTAQDLPHRRTHDISLNNTFTEQLKHKTTLERNIKMGTALRKVCPTKKVQNINYRRRH